jgi:hypothetical protein
LELINEAKKSKEHIEFPTEQLIFLKDVLEFSNFIDQREQAKLQWLQNPNQISRYDLQNLRRETIGMIGKKEREYLKGKINELVNSNKKISETFTEA